MGGSQLPVSLACHGVDDKGMFCLLWGCKTPSTNVRVNFRKGVLWGLQNPVPWVGQASAFCEEAPDH